MCWKYCRATEPAAFAKLRKVPTEVLNAAKLMMELNLSRAELKKVHEYCNNSGVGGKVIRFPDAKKVKRHVRQACLRTVEDGRMREVFRVDKDYPGCPAQTITFEVRRYSVCCLYLTSAQLFFYIPVDRYSSALCGDAPR